MISDGNADDSERRRFMEITICNRGTTPVYLYCSGSFPVGPFPITNLIATHGFSALYGFYNTFRHRIGYQRASLPSGRLDPKVGDAEFEGKQFHSSRQKLKSTSQKK
jgi:hypothetical protein